MDDVLVKRSSILILKLLERKLTVSLSVGSAVGSWPGSHSSNKNSKESDDLHDFYKHQGETGGKQGKGQ